MPTASSSRTRRRREERIGTLLRKAVWLGSGQRPAMWSRLLRTGAGAGVDHPSPAEAPSEAAKEEPTPPPPFAAPLPVEPPVATPQPPASHGRWWRRR